MSARRGYNVWLTLRQRWTNSRRIPEGYLPNESGGHGAPQPWPIEVARAVLDAIDGADMGAEIRATNLYAIKVTFGAPPGAKLVNDTKCRACREPLNVSERSCWKCGGVQ